MMGKFKKFLINEKAGLGDIGRNVSQFYHSTDLGDKIAGAFSDNAEMYKSEQPFSMDMSADLEIPSMARTGVVELLWEKKNPVRIRLSDGTEANISPDEYLKLAKQDRPVVGKTMTIIFQRHPQDASGEHSKIEKFVVRD